MKISQVVYKKPSEVAKMKRFDLVTPPRKQAFYLTPLAWLLSLPDLLKYGAKITKVGIKGLKPPYILLATHNGFFDFKMATKAISPMGQTILSRSMALLIVKGLCAKSVVLVNGSLFKI